MDNIIIISILTLVIGSASIYIWKARKKGVKCIGCPSAKGGACQSSSGCKTCNCGACSDK